MASAPSAVDGTLLTQSQRDRLQDMMDAVKRSDPTRSESSILNHALGAFYKTAFQMKGRWVDRQKFSLNNGDGPVVVPSWSSLLDG